MKLIFFGPPGSGKGTYASRIAPRLGIAHISTGDIFREEISKRTKLGTAVEKYLKAGKLVPDGITIEVLKKRIKEKDCNNGFVLDGYPRTIEQIKALEKITKIDIVLYFRWPEGVLIKKALARRVCEKCGTIYNVADIRAGKLRFPPLQPKVRGKCDKCGGKVVRRKDDTLKVIKDRMDVYRKQSEPLMGYYKKRRLIRIVNVVGSPEVMIPIIMDVIKKSTGR